MVVVKACFINCLKKVPLYLVEIQKPPGGTRHHHLEHVLLPCGDKRVAGSRRHVMGPSKAAGKEADAPDCQRCKCGCDQDI